ncbi:methionyl aminopeptidase [Yasminevirus sp. GU-2018]|uniref:Methionyl aminopeptidase n=1 Tax=Yasminevirus sp. GU-2018 TaxID=2420051 RepID=A0A5K0U9G9_9VIRU|nr:methionyl aminopeptidase [Yasminevirus sp. GU-2018]
MNSNCEVSQAVRDTQGSENTSEQHSKKSVKLIKHGEWNFEYNPKQNVFSSSVESFEKSLFEQSSMVAEYSDRTKLTEKDLEDFRRASLIHKIARKKALSMLYTGARLADLVDAVEDIILKMCRQDPKTYYLKGSPKDNNSGLAFPVGVNINNVVAHDSKTISQNGKVDSRVFFKGEVVKIDIGVHINGRIIDSAFTHIVTDKPGVHDSENIYNSVLEASRDSMFNAIKMAGPDQRLDEMSECIDEIIRSYEVTMGNDGATIPIRPVKGIGGHNIKQYRIHGGKLILSEPDYDIQGDTRMEEDEIYAIETYATTGMGVMTQNTELNACTHFMEENKEVIESNKKITKKDKKFFRDTELYGWLQTRQGLPFSSSWIDLKSIHRVDKAFKLGIPSGQMLAYPPLFDENNSVVAQFEHTIHVNPNSVEILSLGEDY